jgi:hypothetical protein
MWIFLTFIVLAFLGRRQCGTKRRDIRLRERQLERQIAEHRAALREMLEAYRTYRAETERIVAAMVREIHAAQALGSSPATSQSERDLATIHAIKWPNQ